MKTPNHIGNLAPTIEGLQAENERLRALVKGAYAEAWEDSKGWRTHDMCWEISKTRAALQPKEGNT